MSASLTRTGTIIIHAIAVTVTLAIASGYLPQQSNGVTFLSAINSGAPVRAR